MNNTYNLWQLLKNYSVVIPVIQRDYAQGRKDNDFIRKAFLSNIKDCIESGNPMTLDFVYGNIEGNWFYPLDGQQRLTTLWLIHWFLSIKSGKIDDDRDILKKFSYETRTSSREFCKALCKKIPSGLQGNLVNYIKAQTWFYSSWLQDPTICAILRTIGEEKELGKGNKDNNDDLESLFKGIDYGVFRELLISSRLIGFELMVIGNEKLPISDDLYIKMNARGKALTNFENFKADLVSWVQNPKNPEAIMYETFHPDLERIRYKHYFPAQIDNTWTDVFWSYSKNKMGQFFTGKIDEVFFSFINRFVLNEICLHAKMTPAEFGPKEGTSSNPEKNAFDKLFGTSLRGSGADDTQVKYEGFETYLKYLTFEEVSKLDRIFKVLADDKVLSAIDSSLDISDDDEDSVSTSYSFFPQFELCEGSQNVKLIATKQKERVYFLSVCLFLEKYNHPESFDYLKFKRWMRVTQNLIENATIDNVSAMVTCMRLIYKLSQRLTDNSNDIYSVLSNFEEPLSTSQLECQLTEEIEKAKQILRDERWERKIVEAENYAFFKGSIRFLYRNVSTISWSDFDSKFDKAKTLFEPDRNKINGKTVSALLHQFSSFEEIKDHYLFTTIGYHARYKCWKRDILCSDNGNITSKVNSLLIGTNEPAHTNDYQLFLDSGLINRIIEKAESFKFRYHWRYYWAIYKDYYQYEGVYISENRKEKCEALHQLSSIGRVTIYESSNFYQNGFYWGVYVWFKYNNDSFCWHVLNDGKDAIYKIENDIESKNSCPWDDASSLLASLDSFDWE